MSSSGRPCIVEAERGEGRTGRVCMVSESKDRIRLMGSGMEEPFILWAYMVPPAPGLLCRRMVVYRNQCPISSVYLKQTNVLCDAIGSCQPNGEGVVTVVLLKMVANRSQQKRRHGGVGLVILWCKLRGRLCRDVFCQEGFAAVRAVAHDMEEEEEGRLIAEGCVRGVGIREV